MSIMNILGEISTILLTDLEKKSKHYSRKSRKRKTNKFLKKEYGCVSKKQLLKKLKLFTSK